MENSSFNTGVSSVPPRGSSDPPPVTAPRSPAPCRWCTAACAARPRLTERGASLGEGCVESRAVWRRSEAGVGEIRFHTEALLRVAGGPHLNIGSRLASPAISESRRGGVTVHGAAGPLLPWALSRRSGVFGASVVGIQTLHTITRGITQTRQHSPHVREFALKTSSQS